MKIYNFTIEEDRNWYILTEFKTYDKWENAWTQYISDTTYPATLERCLLKVLHRTKLSLKETEELWEAINTLKTDREEFLILLKETLRWLN